MTERTEVVIVGAGGGGAVLGLALARKGVSTVVLEQAAGPPGGSGGEILQPNGQQVLDRLGLLGQLPPDATKSVRRFHFCRVGGEREGAGPRGEKPVLAGGGRVGMTTPGEGGWERLCTVDYDMLPLPYNR